FQINREVARYRQFHAGGCGAECGLQVHASHLRGSKIGVETADLEDAAAVAGYLTAVIGILVAVAAEHYEIGPRILGDAAGQNAVGDLYLVVVNVERKARQESRCKNGTDIPGTGLFGLEVWIASDDQAALVACQSVFG